MTPSFLCPGTSVLSDQIIEDSEKRREVKPDGAWWTVGDSSYKSRKNSCSSLTEDGMAALHGHDWRGTSINMSAYIVVPHYNIDRTHRCVFVLRLPAAAVHARDRQKRP